MFGTLVHDISMQDGPILVQKDLFHAEMIQIENPRNLVAYNNPSHDTRLFSALNKQGINQILIREGAKLISIYFPAHDFFFRDGLVRFLS